MNRLSFLFSAAISTASCWAQCNISAQVIAQAGCSPVLSVDVITLGGTAPVTGVLKWYAGNTQIWTTQLSGPNGMYTSLQADFMTAAVVDMYDAMGCMTTAYAEFPARVGMNPVCTTTLDAGTGLYTLRAQFIDENGGHIAWDLCQESAVTYQLDGGPTTTVASGWVQESGLYYRLNTQLAPGPHRINWTAGQVVNCGDPWPWRWCFSVSSTDLWLAPTVTVPEQNGVNLALRCGLQGPMATSGVMSDGLRASGLVPLSEPYTALGYSYVGPPSGNTTTPARLAVVGDNAIVDWIAVEVRSPNAPYTVLASQPALLTRTGQVVRPDGSLYLHFPSLSSGPARIALRHSNHLAAMTSPFSLSASLTSINLYSGSSGMFGSDALTYAAGHYCLWAGDATGNGALKYTGSGNDRDPILIAVGSTTPNSTVPNVYDRRDTNLDGVIKYTGTGNDRDIILNNVGSTTPNNTRTQQLP